MMHIKYKLDTSSLNGIGLFADENLKEGQLIYTASPLLDVDLSQEQYDSLNEKEKSEVKYWGFFDDTNNVWHVDFDVSKFINHADDATVTQDPKHKEAYLVTTRGVALGEELTQNYREFETEDDLKKRGII